MLTVRQSYERRLQTAFAPGLFPRQFQYSLVFMVQPFFFFCDVKGERMHCDRKTVFCFSKFIIKSNTRDATGERPRTENCVCE